MIGRARVAVALGAAAIAGGWGYPSERVIFRQGNPVAVVKGRLVAPHRAEYEYILNARAGDTLEIELLTDFPLIYYKVLRPESDRPWVNTAGTGDLKWSGTLPADGEYRVRVYLLRWASLVDEVAKFRVRFALRASTP